MLWKISFVVVVCLGLCVCCFFFFSVNMLEDLQHLIPGLNTMRNCRQQLNAFSPQSCTLNTSQLLKRCCGSVHSWGIGLWVDWFLTNEKDCNQFKALLPPVLGYPKEATDVLFHKARDGLSSKCIRHAVVQLSNWGSEQDEFSSNILLECNTKKFSIFSAAAKNISRQMQLLSQIKSLRVNLVLLLSCIYDLSVFLQHAQISFSTFIIFKMYLTKH